MALGAVIFDLDGTLLDTNWAHIEAWRQAFQSCGYQVPPDRIAVEIGKGGDLLVSAMLGQEAEKKDGDTLRQHSEEAFLQLAQTHHFKVFPGALQLLDTLRARGLRTALATSSKVKHLKAMFASVGLDLSKHIDVLLTADDADASKPAPDVVIAAVEKLGVSPAQCAMVGDTPYDAEAARHAGVAGLGVLSGDNAPETLRRAGARAVWQDVADLLAHLDEALAIASPGPYQVTTQLLEQLMRHALELAQEALAAGEVPAGSVVARADGTILGRAYPQVKQRGDRLAHGPFLALSRTIVGVHPNPGDLLLVSTIEPCVMCAGAGEQLAVETIAYGVRAPENDAATRIVPPDRGRWMPRLIGNVLIDRCRALIEEYVKRVNDSAERRAWNAVLESQ